MHRLPLFVTALVSASALQAQQAPTDRGAWLIGGSAAFQRVRDVEVDRTTTFLDLNPQLGYFVFPGLALTANLRFARASGEGFSVTSWRVGPGATYYFGEARRRLYPYLSGQALWGWGRNAASSPQGGEIVTRDHTWQWRLAGGGALMLVRNAAVTGELFYARARLTARISGGDFKEVTETYGIAVGIAVFVY